MALIKSSWKGLEEYLNKLRKPYWKTNKDGKKYLFYPLGDPKIN